MAGADPQRFYDFSIQVPIRRPRAWERVPQTPFAPRHRGRKVWKRYELRSKKQDGNRDKFIEDGDAEVAEIAERPLKRLRNAPQFGGGKEGANGPGVGGYIATLRSERPGTPRRGSALFYSVGQEKITVLKCGAS